MHFDLVDRVLEVSGSQIVTIKNVTGAEEYLQDHFPSFPVLPGVMMLESMAQAARRLLVERDPALSRHVLSNVRALRYASFVRPGESLRVTVSLLGEGEDNSFDFKGSARILRPDATPGEQPPTSVSGRFTLRPMVLAPTEPAGAR